MVLRLRALQPQIQSGRGRILDNQLVAEIGGDLQVDAPPRAREPLESGALAHAARHRADFMWPWETEPVSVATGILDDETYDWLAVVRGTIESGEGGP